MLAGEGLHPSARGKRVQFAGSRRTVVHGPFGETEELLAGFGAEFTPELQAQEDRLRAEVEARAQR